MYPRSLYFSFSLLFFSHLSSLYTFCAVNFLYSPPYALPAVCLCLIHLLTSVLHLRPSPSFPLPLLSHIPLSPSQFSLPPLTFLAFPLSLSLLPFKPSLSHATEHRLPSWLLSHSHPIPLSLFPFHFPSFRYLSSLPSFRLELTSFPLFRCHAPNYPSTHSFTLLSFLYLPFPRLLFHAPSFSSLRIFPSSLILAS